MNWRDFNAKIRNDEAFESCRVMHVKKVDRIVCDPGYGADGAFRVEADGSPWYFCGKMYMVAVTGWMDVDAANGEDGAAMVNPILIASFARMLIDAGNLYGLCGNVPWRKKYRQAKPKKFPGKGDEVELFATIGEAVDYANRYNIPIHDGNVKRIRYRDGYGHEGVYETGQFGECAYEYETEEDEMRIIKEKRW